tara:strand:- start:1549 stop:1746 length:198 start_codon:yes stop_codon:yes gene_type:complete
MFVEVRRKTLSACFLLFQDLKKLLRLLSHASGCLGFAFAYAGMHRVVLLLVAFACNGDMELTCQR